jgi:phosphinothricin acetyltransferase
VECSAYVDESRRRQGVGRRLYESLFALLKAQGYFNVYAGIAQPNPASEAFHEALGFKRVSVYDAIGYKFDAWRDVAWWALRLCHPEQKPAPPLSFVALSEREDISKHLTQPE